ncbi:MAG TPA: phage portal protein [Clostridia bacterium]|nr:phage portal protein [Clostridia bacterium]
MPFITQIDLIKAIIEGSAPMSTAQIVTEEIRTYKASPEYAEMKAATEYWRNRSDVQNKTVKISSRSNTKIEHPALRKLIRQKVNYLLASPFSISSPSEVYAKALDEIFNEAFRTKISGMATDAIKWARGYLQPYFKDGKLCWARLPATEVRPLWADAEHEELNGFIRFYSQTIYEGTHKREITRAEFWTVKGVQYFISTDGDTFKDDLERPPASHFTLGNQAYNWERIPLVWLKYNDDELPLLHFVKELIDDVNWQKSITSDVLRDIVNFIYILKNYGGANLAEFMNDLRQHMAIKVEGDGGVDKLSAELNIEAVMKFLEEQRRDLYDYGNGVDTKDPNLGNASGVALNFRYTDLDADCRDLGTNLKAALQRAKLFIDLYLQATGKGSFQGEKFDITYAVDMPVNETDTITNCKNSAGQISQRTIVANHPWVKDPDEEIKQLEKERQEAMKLTAQMYPGDDDDQDGEGE